MIIKVQNETPFQVLSNSFTIGPSTTGYELQVGATSRDFTTLFTVAADTPRMVTNVANGSYFRLKNNSGEVEVNWSRTCKDEGGSGGSTVSVNQVLSAGTEIASITVDSTTTTLYAPEGGDNSPIIPAITTLAEYAAISGDVKTGDLIQVYNVDINGDGSSEYGLFAAQVTEEEYEGVVRKTIFWERRDSLNSVLWSSEDYPWMADNDVFPIELPGNGFLISPDSTAEDEEYNGIGFDGDGKPVITHIVPQYDEETGEVTGMTKTDTSIGGGGSVVELTQAEYDALVDKDPNTTYIITDAQSINMDNYAKQADLTTLSGSVGTALEGKADKANVTANTNQKKFPLWNEQGVITGSTGSVVYEGVQTINGFSKLVYGGQSDLGTIYAPTTAGAQYQPLLSNGSGAPVWGPYKFQFITQTAYDALTTKDSTTIYFITGD